MALIFSVPLRWLLLAVVLCRLQLYCIVILSISVYFRDARTCNSTKLTTQFSVNHFIINLFLKCDKIILIIWLDAAVCLCCLISRKLSSPHHLFLQYSFNMIPKAHFDTKQLGSHPFKLNLPAPDFRTRESFAR